MHYYQGDILPPGIFYPRGFYPRGISHPRGLFCHQSCSTPGVSDYLLYPSGLWMSQDMWVESPWVWWGALLLGTRCIMVVNVHLQLRSGTAAQEATVVFQLHVLEEPVIHVLSCH